MEAAGLSETSVAMYQLEQQYMSKECSLNHQQACSKEDEKK